VQAAVIVNPTKHEDLRAFRSAVHAAMAGHGWAEPLWLETTAEESGHGLARAALAGSGVPLGVLPAGTGTCWPATSGCR
jgi:diacylglycerol kinase (ATP)